MNQYQDKALTCIDCGAEFVWSAGEQEFFAQKGFDKPPTRCPEDRKKRRMEKEGRGGGGGSTRPASAGPRTMYPITCANCGKQGEVPFQPKSANVLCADCFRSRNTAPAAPAVDAASEEAPAPVSAPIVEAPADDIAATAPAPTDEPAA